MKFLQYFGMTVGQCEGLLLQLAPRLRRERTNYRELNDLQQQLATRLRYDINIKLTGDDITDIIDMPATILIGQKSSRLPFHLHRNLKEEKRWQVLNVNPLHVWTVLHQLHSAAPAAVELDTCGNMSPLLLFIFFLFLPPRTFLVTGIKVTTPEIASAATRVHKCPAV